MCELTAITSRKEDGMPVADMFPSLRGHVDLAFSEPDKADLTQCDVVFFATPHGVAMAQAPELLAAGVKVIDLAADFRLKDQATFEKWYKIPHTAPGAAGGGRVRPAGTEPRGDQEGAPDRQPGLLPDHDAAGLSIRCSKAGIDRCRRT